MNTLATAGSRAAKWRDYLIVILALTVSGNPVVDGFGRERVLVAVAMVLFALLMKHNLIMPTGRLMGVLFIFTGIFVVQGLWMNAFHAVTVLGFFVKMFIGYAAIRLVANFPVLYVRVVFWLSLLSWPFYASNLLTNGLVADMCEPVRGIVEVNDATHILIYNFGSGIERNASMFWEPGAFAAYLLLAVMLLGLNREAFTRRQFRLALVVLTATVVSTLSTAGLVLLPVCLWATICVNMTGRQKTYALLGALLAAGAWYWTFENVEIVGEKITRQYEEAVDRDEGWEINRFGTLLSDLEYIRERPFFGWGLHSETRYALHGGITVEAQGNGLSDFTAKVGFLGLGAYLACVWMNVYRMSRGNWLKTVLFLLFVVTVLNGEVLLDHPIYLGLMFLEPRPSYRPVGARGRVLPT